MEIVGTIFNGEGIEVPIRRVKHGEKISEPGVYEMPMSWYHDDCCVGPSISSSGIRTIVNKSPLHYWDKSYLNPDRDDEGDGEEAAHFRLGRAAHTLLLEPHDFKALFCTRPPQFDSWRTKDSQKWRAERQMEGMTVLDPKEMQQVVGMCDALKAHPLYKQGILEGHIELSIIWQDKKTGVWLKARPDAVPQGSNIFADVKSTTDASPTALRKKVFGLGYDVQMALGTVGMHEVLRRSMEEFVVVGVEVKRPHGVLMAPIHPNEISTALLFLRKGLTTFAECLKSNVWPSYDQHEGEYLGRTDWERKHVEHLIETGQLPKEF